MERMKKMKVNLLMWLTIMSSSASVLLLNRRYLSKNIIRRSGSGSGARTFSTSTFINAKKLSNRNLPSSNPSPTLPPSADNVIQAKRSHARAEPPLVEAARKKSVKQRNVWESYLGESIWLRYQIGEAHWWRFRLVVLGWKPRLYFSLGLGAFALIGLYGGDVLVPEVEEKPVI